LEPDGWRARSEILKRLPNRAVCAEIGVWKGDFSHRILLSTAPLHLHLVDPWRFEPQWPARWYGGSAARSQADMDAIYLDVVRRFCDVPEIVIHRLPSGEAAELFPDKSFDWVYIDGNHSHSEVLSDLRSWWPKVRPGGDLAGDDYRWKDEHGTRSVQRAVKEFVLETRVGVEVVGQTQFIIRRTH
jgi:hypothetical protein